MVHDDTARSTTIPISIKKIVLVLGAACVGILSELSKCRRTPSSEICISASQNCRSLNLKPQRPYLRDPFIRCFGAAVAIKFVVILFHALRIVMPTGFNANFFHYGRLIMEGIRAVMKRGRNAES
jgi:hypothetical protein